MHFSLGALRVKTYFRLNLIPWRTLNRCIQPVDKWKSFSWYFSLRSFAWSYTSIPLTWMLYSSLMQRYHWYNSESRSLYFESFRFTLFGPNLRYPCLINWAFLIQPVRVFWGTLNILAISALDLTPFSNSKIALYLVVSGFGLSFRLLPVVEICWDCVPGCRCFNTLHELASEKLTQNFC